MASKVVNWAETSDDDYLPSSTVEGPDEKGIKKIIDYRREDDGSKIKVTRKIKVVVRQRKIAKSIADRSRWAKFGMCKGVISGAEIEVTYFTSRDEIMIETPEDEAKKDAGLDIMATIRAGLLKKATNQRLRASGLLVDGEGGGALKTGTALSRDGGGPSSMEMGGGEGKYKPPARQAGGGAWGGGGGSQDRDETNTLRVTNISEDTTEDDLKELFRPFGQLSRTYLAKDRETGASRGFAYVSYIRKEDAERAMGKLDGYGYDYLILSVEWAKPSGKDEVGSQNVMKYATGYGGALPQGKGD